MADRTFRPLFGERTRCPFPRRVNVVPALVLVGHDPTALEDPPKVKLILGVVGREVDDLATFVICCGTKVTDGDGIWKLFVGS